MKKGLLAILLLLAASTGYSQNVEYMVKPTRIGLYGGMGFATSNNYDYGASAGLDFQKCVRGSMLFIGAQVFLQGYSLYWDNEAYGNTGHTGYAGMQFRHASKYVFVAPTFQKMLWVRSNFIPWVYVNIGAGFKMSGYDSVRTWDHSNLSSYPVNFDSTIDDSKNLKSMVLRIGVGLAQDINMGGNWWFTFKEDFGFVPSGTTTTGTNDAGSPAHTQYSPGKLSPVYASLQLGITYIKSKKRN
jgi:hypothetical protein